MVSLKLLNHKPILKLLPTNRNRNNFIWGVDFAESDLIQTIKPTTTLSHYAQLIYTFVRDTQKNILCQRVFFNTKIFLWLLAIPIYILSCIFFSPTISYCSSRRKKEFSFDMQIGLYCVPSTQLTACKKNKMNVQWSENVVQADKIVQYLHF